MFVLVTVVFHVENRFHVSNYTQVELHSQSSKEHTIIISYSLFVQALKKHLAMLVGTCSRLCAVEISNKMNEKKEKQQ